VLVATAGEQRKGEQGEGEGEGASKAHAGADPRREPRINVRRP
jgi:hypothetical protein